MVQHDVPYLQALEEILDKGVQKGDRTGVGTISRFGMQMRFDLSEGFPLLTTKKLWFKGIVWELLWFLSGSTNVNDLPEGVQKWWLPWADKDGNLGPTYGESLRLLKTNTDDPIKVTERELPDITLRDEIQLEPEINSKDNFVGSEIKTPYGVARVIRVSNEKTSSGHKQYDVQFIETGSIRTTTKTNILRSLKDRYVPIISSVGYLGDTIIGRDSPHFFLYSIWASMIKRCYDEKDRMYRWYGGRGVSVHPNWHNFSNFYRDAQELPNWCLARKQRGKREWHLDKDYYNSNVYSRNTCVWLKSSDNSLYSGKPIISIDQTGNTRYHYNQRSCAKDLGLSDKKINRVLKGKYSQHKGYHFDYYTGEDIIRKPLPFDQVGWVLNEIRSNPNSRRLVISTWNAAKIDQCRLPPCHGLVIHFEVSNKKLSCHTYQRSADFFIGVPNNIASYALLTHIFASMTGLEVGELIYSFGDAHLYLNSVEQAKIQLSRRPKQSPKIKLNNWGQGINDWSFNDFELIDYKYHPAIKAEIAV